MLRIFIGLIIVFIFGCKKSEVLSPSAVLPVPTKHQLEWQEKELFAFIHFTINTFTGKEWGYGDESPDIFNPVEFTPDQWAKALKEAGFKGAILTAKHHDGFCLWPGKFTKHSVRNSVWEGGNGDVVAGFRDACNKYGLEFGIYLSPWDRNHTEYGSPDYIEYYQNQLNELLDKYGPIFEIWFDGANGGDGYYGGAREMRKIDDQVYYKWGETFKIVKGYNPKTIIRGDARNALCESRWCGNEKGYVGETNWNMINPDTLLAMGGKRTIGLNTGDINGNVWMPAEVDVSIRPGWFYHESEDSLVKTPDELFNIYLQSIGRGANLLLNIAPDRRGLIPPQDIENLLSWRKKIDETFSNNLALEARVHADSYRGRLKQYAASNLNDGDKNTYWATDDEVIQGSVEFDFGKTQLVKYVVLQEYIQLGQRVRNFSIEAWDGSSWQQVAQATTIGHKRIVSLEQPFETQKIKISIEGSKACPVLSNIEIY